MQYNSFDPIQDFSFVNFWSRFEGRMDQNYASEQFRDGPKVKHNRMIIISEKKWTKIFGPKSYNVDLP